MRKLVILCVCLLISTVFLSACNVSQKNQTIKYERKLEKYLPRDSARSATTSNGAIDLSEGPRLKYQADFGPRDVSFDLKLNTRY